MRGWGWEGWKEEEEPVWIDCSLISGVGEGAQRRARREQSARWDDRMDGGVGKCIVGGRKVHCWY